MILANYNNMGEYVNQIDFHKKIANINTLFQFIKNNKDEQFLEFISNLTMEEVDINIKDENENYLIQFAIMKNNKAIIKKLLEYNAIVDIIDSEGHSILYYPIKFGYNDIIDILLDYDKKIVGISLVNMRDSRGNIPIFYAIQFNNKYALQELLINGADPNYKNNQDMNALHFAVLKKDVIFVKMLLRYIKNLDSRTQNGSTALHFAVNFELVDIVKILVEKGANVNIREYQYDFSPIFYSVFQNNLEITKMLVSHGANPNQQDYQGNTIIHYSVVGNHDAITDHIFQTYDIAKKDISSYDENINVRVAKHHKIDPDVINIDGFTILHIMLEHYEEKYEKYIKKLLPFANINYQNNSGNTALHIVADKNLWELLEPYLNIKKMNIYIQNNEGNTVLDLVKGKDKFIDIVIRSYFNYLRKYPDSWILEWQNKCSTNETGQDVCLDQIRKSIIDDKISIPQKRDKKMIIVEQEELVEFTTFTGNILDVLIGFKYLAKKYPDAKFIISKNQIHDPNLEAYYKSIGVQENLKSNIINFEIKWVYQKLFFPPDFEKCLAILIRNKKTRYVIIPIGIILSNGNHSNALFMDLDKMSLERFEPHGSGYPILFNYNPGLLDDILFRKMNNIITEILNSPTKITYYQPKNYLPKIGFQTFENIEVNYNKNIGDPNGFCTLWCIWYLDYRLKYSDRKPSYIVKKLINHIRSSNLSFRNLIRNYSSKITQLRDSYLSAINRNINDYVNGKLTDDDISRLVDNIIDV